MVENEKGQGERAVYYLGNEKVAVIKRSTAQLDEHVIFVYFGDRSVLELDAVKVFFGA